MDKTHLMNALERAIRPEAEACSFYLTAAGKTQDEGGADMFRQLAEFEKHHAERLSALKASLDADGSWIDYEGLPQASVPGPEAAGRPATGDHADALEALRIPIAAEEKAETEYRSLAKDAPDKAGREMFERLASEEATHRKLLDDQFYALSNRGVWLWGD